MTGFELRHARWRQRRMLGWYGRAVLGLCIVLAVSSVFSWGTLLPEVSTETQLNTFLIIAASFVVSAFVIRRFAQHGATDIIGHIGPIVAVVFLLAVALVVFLRAPYSRPALLLGAGTAWLWWFMEYAIYWRRQGLRLAVVPGGRATQLKSTHNTFITQLREPNLDNTRVNAVVADLQSNQLEPQWQRFLAKCALQQIPVLHVQQAQEAITGRIPVEHLSENHMGSLLPSPVYTVTKRLLDTLAVLATLPLTLPLMLFTAIIVKLDSPGPALFKQQRVGQGDTEFTLYKFRSMRTDSEKNGAQFASQNDSRITRVGHFIRKTRLDELPQLLNVLKGDMSLIGPRPEQRVFVNQFRDDIAFYDYRHVVKPGITGWAQVMQGYASDAESTRLKVQYDFYYIKHLSFWLDMLIAMKTVRILLTGWGAR